MLEKKTTSPFRLALISIFVNRITVVSRNIVCWIILLLLKAVESNPSVAQKDIKEEN